MANSKNDYCTLTIKHGQIGCLENDDLENNDLENNDLENDDLENNDLENDDLKKTAGRGGGGGGLIEVCEMPHPRTKPK